MSRVAFVMEQHIGHKTYYLNLRRAVEQDTRITPLWTPMTYESANPLLDRIPGIARHVRGSLHGVLQARRALSDSYDVAFFNTQVPAVLAGGGVRRRPYVIATDITPAQYDAMGSLYGHAPDRDGPLARYKRRTNITLLRGADRVLPWSTWTAASLVKDYGVDPERIDVIPPGVDLAHWRPGPPQPGRLPRILFVGGDLYRKGGAALLEAFRSLPPGQAELHIVTRTRLEPEAGVQCHYDLQPNSPELIRLYRQADIFAFPTEADAFGIAAVEACASGLATIATAVGGLGDVIADGENGYLIGAGDAAALARHLRRLVDDAALRERMGRAARARAEQRFDAQRNATRVIGHLLEAAQRPCVAGSQLVRDRP